MLEREMRGRAEVAAQGFLLNDVTGDVHSSRFAHSRAPSRKNWLRAGGSHLAPGPPLKEHLVLGGETKKMSSYGRLGGYS